MRPKRSKRRGIAGRGPVKGPELRSEPEVQHMDAIMAEASAPVVATVLGYVCATRGCQNPIDPRFPSFEICTPCAMRRNAESCAPWREQQREVSRARIAKLKEDLNAAD